MVRSSPFIHIQNTEQYYRSQLAPYLELEYYVPLVFWSFDQLVRREVDPLVLTLRLVSRKLIGEIYDQYYVAKASANIWG